ncbi:beta-lactamase family protein [Paenibacillus donghaensis]|uniref:serine hydrolase domain-containing protein n=1 Tax=Paenibacillus donghaensis TaxID=414771 RepID=UPI00188313B1|nr:serine hydrolase domain-containing protein [Paenibacillus donghaensis]MBE9914159.1 beta-lactamase family protein [Paenibacillus donghaensis]
MKTSAHFEVSEKLNTYMDALADQGYFNGAVLVAQENQIILSKGFGMANFEHDVHNTSTTKFRLGALTKSFTSVAIIQLQDQGLLDANDPITLYIPNYPNGNIITIHHLLTNSSGIPDYPTFPHFWKKTMKLYSTIEQTIESFKDKPLQFTPGEGYNYTSSSFLLLSYIIEKVSGMSYQKYITDHLLSPLNMRNTGIEDGRTLLKHFASGYSICKGIIPTEYVDMSLHAGAGGMYSTVEDLYLWDRALSKDGILTQQQWERLFGEDTSPFGSYGWVVTEQFINNKSRKRVWHNGTMNGFYAEFNRYVDEDITIIVLSNVNLTPVDVICERLAKIVMGEEVLPPNPFSRISIAPNELRKYAGIYNTGEEATSIDSTRVTELREALDKLSSIDNPKFAVGLFYETFYQYGIDTTKTAVVTYEEDTLYLFIQKNWGAWFKYEIVPLSKEDNSLICTTLHIKEQIEFRIEPNGRLRLIHLDPHGHRTEALNLIPI